ncbi:hypothetical protein M407DRAFT_35125 [Tulasnella calospora MUT 4182]|uniref:F-box domain-containing protein n=1 Tax=Tulasnella calospora MUT 4182 TaxID=1051891 RepID=A0A0C3PM07_9AGAM|nr:hypothetical protein M407DRAFT_35125 [Tulasnella calospora MUT 4182]
MGRLRGSPQTLAVQNSTRFRSMDIQIHPTDSFYISDLLESTTVLVSLTVEVARSEFIEDEFEEVVLSDGAPLKRLVLRDMPFKFDCPRLSRLVTLHLDGSAVPASLRTLIQLLSAASAHLEQLTIARAINDSQRLEDDCQPYSSITFPRLTELQLRDIMPLPSTKLVASIYAPVCSRLRGGSRSMVHTMTQPS